LFIRLSLFPFYDNIIFMSRKQSPDPAIKKEIAARFSKAVEIGMGLTPAEVSRRLGYANQTTIQAIKRGASLPDFARLALYRDQLRNQRGSVLNLHWLITGQGKPFIRTASEVEISKQSKNLDDDIIIKLSSMSSKQKNALARFLVEIG
jgi:hypothetical protein